MPASLKQKYVTFLTDAWEALPKLELAITWEFFKGNLSLAELLEYENINIKNAPMYIQKDYLQVKEWKEYLAKMNAPTIEKEIGWCFIPRFLQYFELKSKRVNKTNGRIQELSNIYPNRIAAYCELVYWQNDVLNIQHNKRASLERYMLTGFCAINQVHGLMQTHISSFAHP